MRGLPGFAQSLVGDFLLSKEARVYLAEEHATAILGDGDDDEIRAAGAARFGALDQQERDVLAEMHAVFEGDFPESWRDVTDREKVPQAWVSRKAENRRKTALAKAVARAAGGPAAARSSSIQVDPPVQVENLRGS